LWEQPNFRIAIENPVSEAIHLRKAREGEKLNDKQRVWDVVKSHTGCYGKHVIEIFDKTYSWEWQGDFTDPTEKSTDAKVLTQNWLKQQPYERFFNPDEIANAIGKGEPTVKVALQKLVKESLVECKKEPFQHVSGTKHRSVYRIATQDVTQRNLDPSASNEGTASIPDGSQLEIVDILNDLPDPDLMDLSNSIVTGIDPSGSLTQQGVEAGGSLILETPSQPTDIDLPEISDLTGTHTSMVFCSTCDDSGHHDQIQQ
jgi:hypothetical protein